jgi:hypothetical protein
MDELSNTSLCMRHVLLGKELRNLIPLVITIHVEDTIGYLQQEARPHI